MTDEAKMDVSKLMVGGIDKHGDIKCPHCGWAGSNYDDISATFHEEIEWMENEDGKEFYHCTCCDNYFRM